MNSEHQSPQHPTSESTHAEPAATATLTNPLNELTAPSKRKRLPDTRQSITHKFNISGHEGYLTVGIFEDGTPGEVFIKLAKEGSTMAGLADTIGILTSLCLQHGVPVETLTNKLSGTRFEPAGHTNHPEIRITTSLSDYIFRWLGLVFSSTTQTAEPETN